MLAPENLTEWELALTGGAAQIGRRAVRDARPETPGGSWIDDGFFPLVVESSHDRALHTTSTVPAIGDELIGIQLPGILTANGARVFIDATN